MESPYLTTKQAAAYLGLKNHKTMKNWRTYGTGPDYHPTPTGRIRYKKEDLDAWIEKNPKAKSTAQARLNKAS